MARYRGCHYAHALITGLQRRPRAISAAIGIFPSGLNGRCHPDLTHIRQTNAIRKSAPTGYLQSASLDGG